MPSRNFYTRINFRHLFVQERTFLGCGWPKFFSESQIQFQNVVICMCYLSMFRSRLLLMNILVIFDIQNLFPPSNNSVVKVTHAYLIALSSAVNQTRCQWSKALDWDDFPLTAHKLCYLQKLLNSKNNNCIKLCCFCLQMITFLVFNIILTVVSGIITAFVIIGLTVWSSVVTIYRENNCEYSVQHEACVCNGETLQGKQYIQNQVTFK